MGKADLHIHTSASDGGYTNDFLLDGLVEAQINVAAITDHDTIKGALAVKTKAFERKLPIKIIIGEEVTSCQGHIVGLFLNERVRPGLSAEKTVAAIHAQGGLAIMAHPERHLGLKDNLRLLQKIPFDGLEIGSLFDYQEDYIHRWRMWNREKWRLAEIGSTDSHTPHFFGRGYTEFPGTTALDLRKAIERRLTKAMYEPFTNWEKWVIRFTYAKSAKPKYLIGGAIELIEDLFKGRL